MMGKFETEEDAAKMGVWFDAIFDQCAHVQGLGGALQDWFMQGTRDRCGLMKQLSSAKRTGGAMVDDVTDMVDEHGGKVAAGVAIGAAIVVGGPAAAAVAVGAAKVTIGVGAVALVGAAVTAQVLIATEFGSIAADASEECRTKAWRCLGAASAVCGIWAILLWTVFSVTVGDNSEVNCTSPVVELADDTRSIGSNYLSCAIKLFVLSLRAARRPWHTATSSIPPSVTVMLTTFVVLLVATDGIVLLIKQLLLISTLNVASDHGCGQSAVPLVISFLVLALLCSGVGYIIYCSVNYKRDRRELRLTVTRFVHKDGQWNLVVCWSAMFHSPLRVWSPGLPLNFRPCYEPAAL